MTTREMISKAENEGGVYKLREVYFERGKPFHYEDKDKTCKVHAYQISDNASDYFFHEADWIEDVKSNSLLNISNEIKNTKQHAVMKKYDLNTSSYLLLKDTINEYKLQNGMILTDSKKMAEIFQCHNFRVICYDEYEVYLIV